MKSSLRDTTVRQLCDEFAAAATLDYVGFWEVVAAVSERNPESNESERANVTLTVSRCMIDRGLRIFTFESGSSLPIFWQNSTVDDLVRRIREEWSFLHGKAVGLGDVCWFTAAATNDGRLVSGVDQ